jgi:hypothetical protein
LSLRDSYTQHLCPTQDAHLALISDGAHVFGLDMGSMLSIVLCILNGAVLHAGVAAILDTSERDVFGTHGDTESVSRISR